MKKTSVIFEVTENKTVVAAIGSNGFVNKTDITGTDIEKDFIKLLKKLQQHQLTNKIVEALDINTWEQII